MGKITKKVQAIADQLQKVEGDKKKAAASPAVAEIHAVSPLLKDTLGVPKPKGKTHKKKKKEGVAYVKEGSSREPEDKEERLTGYAGLTRRITRGLERAGKGVKFWFDD